MTGMSKRERSAEDWEPEEAIDLAATLEELMSEPPFKEVSSGGENSVTAATRIPMWLYRRVVRIRELKGSPYDINSDVLRDALYIGLRVLHIRFGQTPDWDVETKLAAAVDAVSFSRRVRAQVDELVNGLDEMVKDGDMEKAARNLTDYMLAAVELESVWHKDKVFKLLGESKVIRDVAKNCGDAVQKILAKAKEANK